MTSEHKPYCDYWLPIPEGGIAYPCSCNGFPAGPPPAPAAEPRCVECGATNADHPTVRFAREGSLSCMEFRAAPSVPPDLRGLVDAILDAYYRYSVRGTMENATALAAARRALDTALAALTRERDEAEQHIAAMRGPLLHYFGTTDPELLAEVWSDSAASSDERTREHAELRERAADFARDLASNYDHDGDAHRYNNRPACIVCKAEAFGRALASSRGTAPTPTPETNDNG
jgi:hypothetical protein